MSTPNRSIDVRRQARANLLKMRQARLNRRGGPKTPGVSVDAINPDEVETPTAEAFADDTLDEIVSTEGAKAPDDTLTESEETSADLDTHGETPKDKALNSPMPSSAPETSPGVTVLDPALDISEFDTDLSKIPGAGPGLIWMLWNASVRSLEDLAAADPANLTSALGPVGIILDVEALITFARNGSGAAD